MYTFTTDELPAGDFEVKAAIDESWDVNFGLGGEPDGPNIPFSVPTDFAEITFIYGAESHVLTVSGEGGFEGNVSEAGAHWVSEDTIVWDVAVGPATPLPCTMIPRAT